MLRESNQKQIVPRSSAVIPGALDSRQIQINEDHINMCKFGSREDNGYVRVSDAIREMVGDAPSKVNKKWWKEDKINKGTPAS